MTRLGFLERIGLGLALTVTLTLALARSPLWHGADILATLLPDRYTQPLDALPGTPHTSLAFMLFLIGVNAGLLIPKRPLLIPSLITAGTLTLAAYPWSIIRWHEIFPDLFGTPRDLNPLDWILLALPVLLLIATAAILQIRATVAHYSAKGIQEVDLNPVQAHLAREAIRIGLVAAGITLLAGILLAIGRGIPAPGILRENPLIVLLLAVVLLLAGVITGTRLFAATKDLDDTAGKSS